MRKTSEKTWEFLGKSSPSSDRALQSTAYRESSKESPASREEKVLWMSLSRASPLNFCAKVLENRTVGKHNCCQDIYSAVEIIDRVNEGLEVAQPDIFHRNRNGAGSTCGLYRPYQRYSSWTRMK